MLLAAYGDNAKLALAEATSRTFTLSDNESGDRLDERNLWRLLDKEARSGLIPKDVGVATNRVPQTPGYYPSIEMKQYF